MKNLRKYGIRPFSVAVVHGGPGAPGEMAPVARKLSKYMGVLEPLQSRKTLEGQVKELKNVLENNACMPVTLIGHSWGAMLCFIFAALNPKLVGKLILISSGVFEDKYAAGIMKTRLARLKGTDLKAVEYVFKGDIKVSSRIFERFGRLVKKADSYDLVPSKNEVIKCDYRMYNGVWKDAQRLRASGKLILLGKRVKCSVTAIHGSYDPHPAEGVRTPLSGVLKDFKFILLDKCGHYPWLERAAKSRFYEVLIKELQ